MNLNPTTHSHCSTQPPTQPDIQQRSVTTFQRNFNYYAYPGTSKFRNRTQSTTLNASHTLSKCSSSQMTTIGGTNVFELECLETNLCASEIYDYEKPDGSVAKDVGRTSCICKGHLCNGAEEKNALFWLAVFVAAVAIMRV